MITPSYRNIYGRYTRNTGRSIWPWAELYQDIMKYRVGPDALMNLLTMGRPDSLFIIGINKVHFDALNFGKLIEELRVGSKISYTELREIPMYSKTNHEHGKDVALAQIFRKSE